jgi:hypothetical protein
VDPLNVFALPALRPDEVVRFREHLTQLANELKVEWRGRELESFLCAEGDFGEGWFTSPTIRTEFDYLVGLHEAGHQVLGRLTFQDDGVTVIFDNEVAVWKWVRANALVEVSEMAWRACYSCLMTHEPQRPPQRCVDELRDLLPPSGAPMIWR